MEFKVLVKSPFSHLSGYGNDGWGMIRALMNWGCDVYVQPTFLDVPIPKDLLHLFAKDLVPPFDLTINHWDPENLRLEERARACTRVAVAWCADEVTEILTRRGWLRHDEVTEGDQALGINTETGLSEWQVIGRVYRSGRAAHQMIRLSGQAHESVTNPSHRWLVRDLRGSWDWRTSATIRPDDSIPCRAFCADLPTEAKYSDAFVELVAWTYTEGWLERGQSVRIGQNERVNPDKTQRIRAALHALCGSPQAPGKPLSCALCGSSKPDSRGRITRARGLCHTCYERLRGRGELHSRPGYGTWAESPRKPDGMVIFNVSRPVSQEIMTACPDKVPSYDFLLSLTRAQLELFISTSIAADGTITASGQESFAQTRGPRMDAFVTACVLAGKRPSRPRPSNWEHLATVGVLKRGEARSLRREAVSYTGVIWCPSVQHGNWLARRDGHVFYTGNTMWEFSSLVPHCRNRNSLRDRLEWFDLVLGYDSVSIQALEPWVPKKVRHRVKGPDGLPTRKYKLIDGPAVAKLQGGYAAADWKFAERDWFGERFCFGMHGALNNRKQPYTALQAFRQLKDEHPVEFDGARMIFHTTCPPLFPEINDLLGEYGIKVFYEVWDKTTLEEFYRACHCLVYPSMGEGKNLPCLEMLTTGGAVVATNWSGHREWLSENVGWPLDYELRPLFPVRYPDGAQYASVSVESVKAAMWDAFTHRDEAKRRGEMGAKLIPQMCDWSVVVENLFRIIRDKVPGAGEVVYNMAQEAHRKRA